MTPTSTAFYPTTRRLQMVALAGLGGLAAILSSLTADSQNMEGVLAPASCASPAASTGMLINSPLYRRVGNAH